jgi:hypothetical protein
MLSFWKRKNTHSPFAQDESTARLIFYVRCPSLELANIIMKGAIVDFANAWPRRLKSLNFEATWMTKDNTLECPVVVRCDPSEAMTFNAELGRLVSKHMRANGIDP